MAWRIIEVAENEATDADLTDGELIGISVLLTHESGEPRDVKYNVYWRAREKIQPAVEKAMGNQDLED